MKEDKLYQELKNFIGGHWTRIENSVTYGIPDAYVGVSGNMWWLELKTVYGRDTIYLRPSQRNWFIRESKECECNGVIFVKDEEPWFVSGLAIAVADFELQGKGRLAYSVKSFKHLATIGWSNLYSLIHKD